MKHLFFLVSLFIVPGFTANTIGGDGIPLNVHVRTQLPDSDWQHIAARYGMVVTMFAPRSGGKDLSAENERVKWIKSLNPHPIMLVYGGSINAANTHLPAWKKPTQHPDWFLKNENGDWVGDFEYGSLHLDPGNSGWREFRAKAYADLIDRYGYDGVFVDLCQPDTHYVNYKKTSKTVNPKTGQAYTDAEWKEAILGLLQAVRRQVGDKMIIANTGRGGTYFKTGAADLLTVVDGIQNEGFTGWTQDPTKPGGITVDEWKQDVDALVDCAKRDKIMVAVANVRKREEGEPVAAFDERYRFITASFLLGANAKSFLRYYAIAFGTPGIYLPGKEVMPECANVSLGEPRDTYAKKDGVYQREFERGKVIVNPTPREMRVPLSGQWKTDTGSAVASPLVLPPRTGAILLKVE